MDHLLGRGLLPDPLARGAIDDFPGAFKQSTTAPDPELSCLGEPLVMPLEGVARTSMPSPFDATVASTGCFHWLSLFSALPASPALPAPSPLAALSAPTVL